IASDYHGGHANARCLSDIAKHKTAAERERCRESMMTGQGSFFEEHSWHVGVSVGSAEFSVNIGSKGGGGMSGYGFCAAQVQSQTTNCGDTYQCNLSKCSGGTTGCDKRK